MESNNVNYYQVLPPCPMCTGHLYSKNTILKEGNMETHLQCNLCGYVDETSIRYITTTTNTLEDNDE